MTFPRISCPCKLFEVLFRRRAAVECAEESLNEEGESVFILHKSYANPVS